MLAWAACAFKDSNDGLGLFTMANHVVDGFAAGRRPHGAGTHREELAVIECPAGVLAGQTGKDRVIGHHLDKRGCAACHLAGHHGHLRQVTQADASQFDPGDQTTACLDSAVDVAAPAVDRMHGDSEPIKVGEHRLHDPMCTSVKGHRHLLGPTSQENKTPPESREPVEKLN